MYITYLNNSIGDWGGVDKKKRKNSNDRKIFHWIYTSQFNNARQNYKTLKELGLFLCLSGGRMKIGRKRSTVRRW